MKGKEKCYLINYIWITHIPKLNLKWNHVFPLEHVFMWKGWECGESTPVSIGHSLSNIVLVASL